MQAAPVPQMTFTCTYFNPKNPGQEVPAGGGSDVATSCPCTVIALRSGATQKTMKWVIQDCKPLHTGHYDLLPNEKLLAKKPKSKKAKEAASPAKQGTSRGKSPSQNVSTVPTVEETSTKRKSKKEKKPRPSSSAARTEQTARNSNGVSAHPSGSTPQTQPTVVPATGPSKSGSKSKNKQKQVEGQAQLPTPSSSRINTDAISLSSDDDQSVPALSEKAKGKKRARPEDDSAAEDSRPLKRNGPPPPSSAQSIYSGPSKYTWQPAKNGTDIPVPIVIQKPAPRFVPKAPSRSVGTLGPPTAPKAMLSASKPSASRMHAAAPSTVKAVQSGAATLPSLKAPAAVGDKRTYGSAQFKVTGYDAAREWVWMTQE